MVNLAYIKEFVTFAQYLSVTKASEALFISKSTLSKHIRQLEVDVGFPLVDRSGSEFHLTQEGEVFYNAFVNITANFAQAKQRCEELRRQSHDTILIQEPSYQDDSAIALFGLVAQIKGESPHMPVRYRRPQRHHISSDLSEGRLDIAILHRTEPVMNGSHVFQGVPIRLHFLAEDYLVLWCHQSHPFAELDDVSLEKMSEMQVITANDVYSPLRDVYTTYCKEAGVNPRFRVIESESPTTFLTSQYLKDTFIIPASARNDIRVKSRREMVVRDLGSQRLRFYCYAVMSQLRLRSFPEIEKFFL